MEFIRTYIWFQDYKLLNNLGVCYQLQNDFDKAIESFNKALELIEPVNHNIDYFKEVL